MGEKLDGRRTEVTGQAPQEVVRSHHEATEQSRITNFACGGQIAWALGVLLTFATSDSVSWHESWCIVMALISLPLASIELLIEVEAQGKADSRSFAGRRGCKLLILKIVGLLSTFASTVFLAFSYSAVHGWLYLISCVAAFVLYQKTRLEAPNYRRVE